MYSLTVCRQPLDSPRHHTQPAISRAAVATFMYGVPKTVSSRFAETRFAEIRFRVTVRVRVSANRD